MSTFLSLDFPHQPEAPAGQENPDVEINVIVGSPGNADGRSGRQVGHKHTITAHARGSELRVDLILNKSPL